MTANVSYNEFWLTDVQFARRALFAAFHGRDHPANAAVLLADVDRAGGAGRLLGLTLALAALSLSTVHRPGDTRAEMDGVMAQRAAERATAWLGAPIGVRGECRASSRMAAFDLAQLSSSGFSCRSYLTGYLPFLLPLRLARCGRAGAFGRRFLYRRCG